MLGELDPLAPGDGVAAAGARRAYWLTVLLGSGTLAPWNAWLLAYRYLDTVFGQERDVQYVSGRVRRAIFLISPSLVTSQ